MGRKTMTVVPLDTAYRQGYLTAMLLKPKEPPEVLTDAELADWLRGYDHGLRRTIDDPTWKPSMTR